TEGKILAIEHARKSGIPFFGICLGMQLAVVEFARNVAGIRDAVSAEVEEDKGSAVIALMDEQKDVVDMGATMRLGAYPCNLKEDSLAARTYKTKRISERHRHRYEFANAFREPLEGAGLV